MKRHQLCTLGRVAEQMTSEDVLHCSLNFLVVSDNLQRRMNLSSRWSHPPGFPHNAVGDRLIRNLVQRNDCDSASQLTFVQQIFANLFIVHDNKEEPATRTHFHCTSPIWSIIGFDVEQRSHDTL